MVASKRFYSSILFYLLLLPTTLYANERGIPFIPPVYNYNTNNYKVGNQNWSISQGENGILYFGNNNGLLSFDGVNCVLHNLPNNLSVKSILIDKNNSSERIYVGRLYCTSSQLMTKYMLNL